jgi:hypothetical protein
MTVIRCHLNRRMDYKKQWPDPTLPPSPEPQQQQIQDKNVNGVVGAALNESNNKSLISPPHPRPNIDIILSLEDPVYSSTMLGYFQLMGEKTTGSTTNEQGETLESVVAKKALLYFKRTSTTTTVRFFKLLSRNLVDGKFKLVDEPNALFSEFTLYFQNVVSFVFIWILLNFFYHFWHDSN